MGLHNIWEHDGLGIAITGMIIVFAALSLISVFISWLPHILQGLSLVLPAERPTHPAVPLPAANEEELIAAIGVALHQHSRRPSNE
jgi:sodium pump decarboxylase gamma subunit